MNLTPEGFYVFVKPRDCEPDKVIKYIGRYLERPIIATSRIDSYDGDIVTFHYNRHEDNKLMTESIPAIDFIERLIRHIPEKHRILLSFNKWKTSILLSFGYDPLKCPHCGNTMSFLELYHNHKPVSLQELYKKVLSKHACRSPA